MCKFKPISKLEVNYPRQTRTVEAYGFTLEINVKHNFLAVDDDGAVFSYPSEPTSVHGGGYTSPDGWTYVGKIKKFKKSFINWKKSVLNLEGGAS